MHSYDITEWGKPLQQAVRETPQPTGTQVLVKVQYCGVCHSDVHIREGFFELGGGKRFHMTERGMKLPHTMGHEPYGQLVALGPQAQGLADVTVGQSYLVYPWTGCGQCARCAEGKDNWCMTPKFLGVQSPGGYADHLLVPHPKYLVDTTGIDPTFAPILACSGLTTYSAVKKLLPCNPNDAIVVMGAGGLGLMAIAMLKALGHQHIVVGEVDETKWATARDMGASLTFNPQASDALQQLQAVPGGLWGVLDLVGVDATAQLGVAALRKGGRYVVVGLYGGELPLSTVPLAQRALTVQGSYVGDLAELCEVVAMAKAGQIKALPTALCQPDEISGVLDRLKNGQVIGRVIAQFA
jgi:D-arabinose 1-dehydrogenase-like Zn-dependent alcohol dehydrogenase